MAQVPYTENKPVMKEYTMEDVAKHNTDEDPWVVVNGEVLAVKEFLPDHPGKSCWNRSVLRILLIKFCPF